MMARGNIQLRPDPEVKNTIYEIAEIKQVPVSTLVLLALVDYCDRIALSADFRKKHLPELKKRISGLSEKEQKAAVTRWKNRIESRLGDTSEN